MEFLRFLDVFAALIQGLLIGKIPELMEESHRFAPVRYGALRFAGGRGGKSFLGFRVLERVEERDALFDHGLHFRGATRREIYIAELFGRRGKQAIRSKRCGLQSKNKEEQPEGRVGPQLFSHYASPLLLSVILPPVVVFGGVKPFGDRAPRRLDALWCGGYNGNGAVLRSRCGGESCLNQ